jgi:hypothetical protein
VSLFLCGEAANVLLKDAREKREFLGNRYFRDSLIITFMMNEN